jgi:hypothetical protein
MAAPERHVIIDPYVIAVPSDLQQGHAYIDGLITWLPLLNTKRDEASFFQAALHVILQENRFPTHDTLRPLLAFAGTQEYSVVDLLRLVTALAATEPFFEQFVSSRAAVGDDVEVTPPEVIERLGVDLGVATRDSLVLVAVAQENGWCPQRTYWATSVWTYAADWVEATAYVSLVEPLIGDLYQLERRVSAILRVLTETSEIAFADSLEEVYTSPPEAVAVVLHRLRQYDSTIPETVAVTAGARFVASLETHGIQHQPAVLERVFHRAALAAVGRLPQMKGAKLHPVRTATTADAQQVERADGAKLWRCMVTKTGAGYRLHYWTLKDGGVELDQVMVESAV